MYSFTIIFSRSIHPYARARGDTNLCVLFCQLIYPVNPPTTHVYATARPRSSANRIMTIGSPPSSTKCPHRSKYGFTGCRKERVPRLHLGALASVLPLVRAALCHASDAASHESQVNKSKYVRYKRRNRARSSAAGEGTGGALILNRTAQTVDNDRRVDTWGCSTYETSGSLAASRNPHATSGAGEPDFDQRP